MKIIKIACAFFLACGCTTTPKNLYVHPEDYKCDLIIPTIWDGGHPVQYFEHEIVIGQTYHDYYGMQYKLMPTDQPDVFSLRVKVARP